MIRNQQDEAYQMSLEADRRKVSHSHTSDRDFRCFYPGEIISVPVCGKDKKRTATCWPHAGCTSLVTLL